MKKEERLIIKLFDSKKTLTCDQIKKETNIKDPSSTLRDLVYFEYLEKEGKDKFVRTNKIYNENDRKAEKRNENYEIVLNKVFTGSFLQDNLGHELINFIVDDNGQRYVYLNPLGERGEKASVESKYAVHVIKSTLKDVYELVAISKIDNTAKTIYSQQDRQNESINSPIYYNHSFYDIFCCGDKSNKSHVYTYKASNLYIPNDYRIIIKFNCSKAEFIKNDKTKTIDINLMCNLKRSVCYADGSGKKTFSSKSNEPTDIEVLYQIIDVKNGYIKESTENVVLDKLDDEQCFSVINDRTNLEDSMSNQISYFLKRDKNLTYIFLHDFLGIYSIKKTENFEIFREREKRIDLLIKSNDKIIVVENKIDSKINGDDREKNENGKYNSQLSAYYNYIEKKYPKHYKKYVVLAPEYNGLTQEKLDTYYENGEQYELKTYNEMFEKFKNQVYMPLGHESSELGKFLFTQFLKGIEYLTWSTAKQHEKTAYIRLKQRIQELDNKEAIDNNKQK